MKLFYSPGACSLAPHIVLNELGLKFDAVKVEGHPKKYAGGELSAINPKGQVPTLQMANGEVLTEGAVIMQYLADQVPEKNLLPKAGTTDRYRAQEWLNYIATEVHKGFGPLWNKEMPEAAKEIAKKNLAKKFEFLNNHLAKNDFLMGKQFTVADAYLFVVMNWCGFHKIDLSPYPKLMSLVERVQNRPATQAAMRAEGLH